MRWTTRRRLLVSLSVVALAAIASACGGGSDSASPAGVPTPDAAEAPSGAEAGPTSPAADEPANVDATSAAPVAVSGAPVPPPVATSVSVATDRVSQRGNFPPLTDPCVVLAADAVWLEDETLVLGAVHNGDARLSGVHDAVPPCR